MAETLLEMKDVHAWYGESHILHGVNLTVNKGEVVTLLGRNGAGRTTTLKAILGLVGRRSGSIRIDLGGAPVNLTGGMTLVGSATGTVTTVDATVKASIPLVGGRIELARAVKQVLQVAERADDRRGERARLGRGDHLVAAAFE